MQNLQRYCFACDLFDRVCVPLQGFHEQVIMFPPTFKYKPGSTQYSEKRIPSWTDRILHTAYADEQDCALEPLYYK